jgi:AcrR family transcriptional regulator
MAVIGRPRAFDREAALEAAMLVFWRKGYAAASMNDLCDAMGIRSPSLYAAFASKVALYLEAIDHYVKTVGPPIWDKLGEGATARAAIESVILTLAETLPQSASAPAGCMVALGAVTDEWPAPVADVVKSVRLDLLRQIQARLETAVAKGELLPSTDTERLSRFYLGVYQGMAVQARDGATAADLRGVADAAMAAWPTLREARRTRRKSRR